MRSQNNVIYRAHYTTCRHFFAKSVDKKTKNKYYVHYDDSNIVFDGKSLRRPAPAGAGAAWFVDAGFAESHAGGYLGGGY